MIIEGFVVYLKTVECNSANALAVPKIDSVTARGLNF